MSHLRISKCPDCGEDYLSRDRAITTAGTTITRRYNRCEGCQELRDMCGPEMDDEASEADR